VILRLNKPALILAPTIAIRNQWIQRFCELFLETDIKPEWISRDIKHPKFLTVSTYQGLHAACSGISLPDEETHEKDSTSTIDSNSSKYKTAEIIKGLKTQNIGTIVVDEAHHLKNAWWYSLTKIKEAINPTVVGLTATPPFDVSYAEWQRYSDLNGPVDAEISIPELVKEGNLCPHQDYVYFSQPTTEENLKITEYRSRINGLINDILNDHTLITALENHPIFQNPTEHLEWIYSNLESYAATLIFLNTIGKEISPTHLEIIGDRKFVIPELNEEWLEILLDFYFYKDPKNFKLYEEHQQKLINKLKRGGAMERRSVNFKHNRRVNKFINSSIGKLDSIDKIVDFEHDHLKRNLRMVILTDYIRKEYLVQEETNNLPLTKIGVLPIFEKLRRTNNRNMKIGVLTGSLTIIPVSALVLFKEIIHKYQINEVSTTPLPYDASYLIIQSNEKLKHDIVNIITQIFEQGEIEVLIGTKSLLGEGWDAPCINSLILASFVGSYVLSNQMRGRAIRTVLQDPNKTSNIWHLVCIDKTAEDGGDDIQIMKRRFKSFVGICFKNAVIENGFGRINCSENLLTNADIEKSNNEMLKKCWYARSIISKMAKSYKRRNILG